MKNKIYYLLLGIGLGVIITSSINIAFNKPKKVEYTDEQIKEKARDLGMISIKENIENIEKNDKVDEKIDESMEEVPADEEDENVSEIEENFDDIQVVTEVNQNTGNITPVKQVNQNINNTKPKEPVKKNTNNATSKPQSTPQPQKQAKAGHKIVVVESQDTATVVISKLKKAGIIEDEEEFKALIIKYNLQGKLNSGSFELKIGMSYEELLKELIDEKDLRSAGYF